MAGRGAVNGMAVCAGAGGLELGLSIALGDRYRCVAYLERDAAAAATLVARMEDAALDSAPIWDDLATFDGRPWRGVVDILSAGLPCQPFSQAGQRRGDADERYVWPEFFRIVAEVQPAVVFLENVPGILAWFRPIGEELCRLGYQFEAGLFSAAEVGASHLRERFFCLAYRDDGGAGALHTISERWTASESQCDGQAVADAGFPGWGLGHAEAAGGSRASGDASRTGGALAHPRQSRSGRDAESPELNRQGPSSDDCEASRTLAGPGNRQLPQPGRGPQGRDGAGPAGPAVADSNSPSIERRRAAGLAGGEAATKPCEAHQRQWTRRAADDCLPPFPPGPADREAWGRILAEYPELAPAQPDVRRVADGTPSRLDRLRMLGNGVVPLQAAYAFGTLAAAITYNGRNLTTSELREERT